MTRRDDVIRMAREAGFDVIEGEAAWLKDPEGIDSRIWWNDVAVGDVLQRFAQLVAAQAAAEEREACAEVADDYGHVAHVAQSIAAAIRARRTA